MSKPKIVFAALVASIFLLNGVPAATPRHQQEQQEKEASVAACGAWTEVATPGPPGNARLEDVDVLAPWDAWAVGSFVGPLAQETVEQSLAMHWNGSAW